MRQLKFFLLLWLFPITAFTQSIERSAIVSSFGNFNSPDGIIIDWNIGQLFVNTIIENNKFLTQGFLQPIIVNPINSYKELPLSTSIKVVPNPVNSWFAIDGLKEVVLTKAILFSVEGVPVMEKNSNIESIWNLDLLSPGIYFLKFFAGNMHYPSITIVKI